MDSSVPFASIRPEVNAGAAGIVSAFELLTAAPAVGRIFGHYGSPTLAYQDSPVEQNAETTPGQTALLS